MDAPKAKKSRKMTFAKLRDLQGRIPKIFDDWYRQLGQPLQTYPDRVVFLNDMQIERQADGAVWLYLPDDRGKPRLFEDVQIRHLSSWLLSATKRKATAMAIDECEKYSAPNT